MQMNNRSIIYRTRTWSKGSKFKNHLFQVKTHYLRYQVVYLHLKYILSFALVHTSRHFCKDWFRWMKIQQKWIAGVDKWIETHSIDCLLFNPTRKSQCEIRDLGLHYMRLFRRIYLLLKWLPTAKRTYPVMYWSTLLHEAIEEVHIII